MNRKRNSIVGLTAAFVAALGLGLGARMAVDADGDPNSTRAIVETAQQDAPAAQVDALADGVVTLQEVNDAVAQTAQCARDKGVNVEMRAGSDKVPNRVGFAAATLEDGESARQVLVDCQTRYLDRLSQTFSAQARPDAEQTAAGREFMGRCMAARGITVPATITQQVLLNWSMSRDPEVGGPNADCVDQHYRELGFWP